MEPPPGRTWGCAPQTRSRSKTCTTRKLLTAISRMLWDHQCHGGTVEFFPVLSCHPSQSVLPSFTPVLRAFLTRPHLPLKTRQDCRNFAFSKNLQSVQKFLRKKGEGPGGGKGSFFQKVPFPPSGNNSPLPFNLSATSFPAKPEGGSFRNSGRPGGFPEHTRKGGIPAEADETPVILWIVPVRPRLLPPDGICG